MNRDMARETIVFAVVIVALSVPRVVRVVERIWQHLRHRGVQQASSVDQLDQCWSELFHSTTARTSWVCMSSPRCTRLDALSISTERPTGRSAWEIGERRLWALAQILSYGPPLVSHPWVWVRSGGETASGFGSRNWDEEESSGPSTPSEVLLLNLTDRPVDSAVPAGPGGQAVDGLALTRPTLRVDARPQPDHRSLGQLAGLRPPTCPQSLGQLSAPLRVDHTDHKPGGDDSFFLFCLLAGASERTSPTASDFQTLSLAFCRESGCSEPVGNSNCRQWGNVVDARHLGGVFANSSIRH